MTKSSKEKKTKSHQSSSSKRGILTLILDSPVCSILSFGWYLSEDVKEGIIILLTSKWYILIYICNHFLYGVHLIIAEPDI